MGFVTTVSAGTLEISSTGSTHASSAVSLTGTSSLIVNGTVNGTLTTAAGTTLSGSGTIVGHTTLSGIHNPGNSPGIQTFGGNLSYVNGGIPTPTVNWELNSNTITPGSNPNPNFDQIVVGENLDFTDITTINLIFNGAGSSVLWSDMLWDSDQSWVLYDVAVTTSNFDNLTLNVVDWQDKDGNLFGSTGSFSLSQSGQDVVLNFTVPEPSTAVLGGIGLLALLRRRRK